MHPELARLVRRQLKSAELPFHLNVWDLREEFGSLLDRALAQEVEWGGCIALDDSRACIPHPVSGTRYSVSPACRPRQHVSYLGFAHVHLAINDLGGIYPGFSDCDYRAMMQGGDNLALVTNGPEVFGLVATADKTSSPRAVRSDEFAEWSRLYRDEIEGAKTTAAIAEALWNVNLVLCVRLGLAFYRGPWGEPLECMYS